MTSENTSVDPRTPTPCRALYPDETRMNIPVPGLRVVRCNLPTGHDGDHDELVQGVAGAVTWPVVADPRTPTSTTSDDVYAGPAEAYVRHMNIIDSISSEARDRLAGEKWLRVVVDAARAPLLAELADVRLQCDVAEAFNAEIIDALPRCRPCDATGYRTHDDSCIGHPCEYCNARGVVIVDPDAARAGERSRIAHWLRGYARTVPAVQVAAGMIERGEFDDVAAGDE